MNDEVVAGLRRLGLTEFEARSHAALVVRLGEATRPGGRSTREAGFSENDSVRHS